MQLKPGSMKYNNWSRRQNILSIWSLREIAGDSVYRSCIIKTSRIGGSEKTEAYKRMVFN